MPVRVAVTMATTLSICDSAQTSTQRCMTSEIWRVHSKWRLQLWFLCPWSLFYASCRCFSNNHKSRVLAAEKCVWFLSDDILWTANVEIAKEFSKGSEFHWIMILQASSHATFQSTFTKFISLSIVRELLEICIWYEIASSIRLSPWQDVAIHTSSFFGRRC